MEDQSFFVAAAGLYSAAMGVPPDPAGDTYWDHPAGHTARRFTARGLRELMTRWMEQEPGSYPPAGWVPAARPWEGPQAPLSADILRTVAHHPGADCLLPLLARAAGGPVALIVRADRRYTGPDPEIRVYWPGTHACFPAEESRGRIIQLGGVGDDRSPPTRCPRNIMAITRQGSTYTALGPRAPPTQGIDPAWVREVLTQVVLLGHADHDQGGDRGREARAGDHHPDLPVLAGNGQQAREASDAARRLADRAHPAEGHSSDDDPERDHPRQEPEGRTGEAEGRPDPVPAAQGAPQLEQQEHL